MPTCFSLSPLHSNVNHETPINEQQYRIPRTQQYRHNQTMSRNALLSSVRLSCVRLCVRDLIFSLEELRKEFNFDAGARSLYQRARGIVPKINHDSSVFVHAQTHTHTLSFSLSFHLRSTQTSRARRSSIVVHVV